MKRYLVSKQKRELKWFEGGWDSEPLEESQTLEEFDDLVDAFEFYKNYTSNDDVYHLYLYDTLEEEFIEYKEVINKYPE
jgi:coproporphyrinogen III oxidase